MEDDVQKYLYAHCVRRRRFEGHEKIIISGTDPIYIGEEIVKDKYSFLDNKTDDEFKTLDKLLEHIAEELK